MRHWCLCGGSSCPAPSSHAIATTGEGAGDNRSATLPPQMEPKHQQILHGDTGRLSHSKDSGCLKSNNNNNSAVSRASGPSSSDMSKASLECSDMCKNSLKFSDMNKASDSLEIASRARVISNKDKCHANRAMFRPKPDDIAARHNHVTIRSSSRPLTRWTHCEVGSFASTLSHRPPPPQRLLNQL